MMASSTTAAAVKIASVKHNKKVLYHLRYSYHLNRRAENSKTNYYRCKLRDCPGTGKIVDGMEFVTIRRHSGHAVTPMKKEVNELMEVIKNRTVAEGSGGIKAIFTEETQKPQNQTAGKHLEFGKLSSGLEKLRLKNYPPIPSSLQELADALDSQLGQQFAKSIRVDASDDEKQFFRGFLDVDGVQAMFFAESKMLQELKDAKQLHIDGTFKCCPKKPLINQLVTIQFKKGNHILPGIYIFMNGKSTKAYKKVLQFINLKIVKLDPNLLVTDFEKSLRTALRQIFTRAKLVGCSFHHCQAIHRKTQNLGLGAQFKKDKDINETVSMLMACCLLPAKNVRDGFTAVKNHAKARKINRPLSALFKYYERFWLEIEGPEAFSVFGYKNRTNNAIESFHRNLMRLIKTPHPNIWLFLEKLQKVGSQSCHDLAVLERGGAITRTRKQKYVWLDRQIKNASNLLADGELTNMQFLVIAKNFTYNPDRDSLQDEEKENEEPAKKRRRVENTKDSDSDSN